MVAVGVKRERSIVKKGLSTLDRGTGPEKHSGAMAGVRVDTGCLSEALFKQLWMHEVIYMPQELSEVGTRSVPFDRGDN